MLCGFELYSRWVPLIVKYLYEKEPRYNETSLNNEHIFAVPWPVVKSRFHCSPTRPQNLGNFFKLF